MAPRRSWRDWLRGSEAGASYQWMHDDEGLNFYLEQCEFNKIECGEGTPLAQTQHVALSMLAEQGDAHPLPNGFVVAPEVAVRLDQETSSILQLPPQYEGVMSTDFEGDSTRSNFKVQILCESPHGRMTQSYDLVGPLLRFTTNSLFLLNGPQYSVLDGLRRHESGTRTEYENLHFVKTLQEAYAAGCKIDLAHFKNLDLMLPGSITIAASADSDGNLLLTPSFGQDAPPDRIEKVLGQLRHPQTQSLRVGDEIILLDSGRMKAVHEVLTNRKVPKNKIGEFLRHPTAFLDGALVDLDLGFSFRVHGATRFVQAYFGETDESKINWFGHASVQEGIASFKDIAHLVTNEKQVDELENLVKEASVNGATVVEHQGELYDIADAELVESTFERLRRNLKDRTLPEYGIESPRQRQDDHTPVVVDIDLIDHESVDLNAKPEAIEINDVLYPEAGMDWSHYLRKPYPHQNVGVRWIVGLARQKGGMGGGLLADDMGLGKTYMALSAIDQLYRMDHAEGAVRKPVLVVAPLSVLHSWKEEVEKTFKTNPFRDIVILQSDADLNMYRVGGVEIQNQVITEDASAEIRFSLKIGSEYLSDRLDMDQRLVITTYQTLRDYQFSLCMVDWGFVVFDEAQNIKNPNTLQARAAKGLKSDFRLLATGTPVENSLAEFWCIMDTACPTLLGTYQDYRKKYIAPIRQAAGDEIDHIREKVGIALRKRVGSYMLRRDKEEQLSGLPDKRIYLGEHDAQCEYDDRLDRTMAGNQLSAYDQALRSHSVAVKSAVLATLHSLRDLSLHPWLKSPQKLMVPEKSQDLRPSMLESGKLESLLEILDDIRERGEKCIVFVVNRRMQMYLSVALAKVYALARVGVVNGDTKTVSKSKRTETRLTLIRSFEECEGFNIIIMSPIAAGVGLTITGANNVIHLERHWNPAKEAQATDRVYRIGQKRDVNVYVPILRHPQYESFDVNLHGLLSSKTLLRDAIVVAGEVLPEPGGLDSFPGLPAAPLTAEDMLGLSWEQFEALCAELFRRHYVAEDCWLTSEGGDYGADVVLNDRGHLVLIQCKHTTRATYDGYHAMLDVKAATIKYENLLKKTTCRLVFATSARMLSRRTQAIADEYGVEVFKMGDIGTLLSNNTVCMNDVMIRLDKQRLDASR